MSRISVRATKTVAIVLIVYVLIVVAFESLLGFFQPQSPETLVITTVDAEGGTHDRVLSGLASDGRSYVAVNHWPRAWYRRVLDNPNVQITRDGETEDYVAIPVSGEEYAQVARDNPAGIVFRIITGFAPRYFVRLDPRRTEEDE